MEGIKYLEAEKCWTFLGHTFLRFQEDPLFVDRVVIEGKEYKATRCYGSPPLVIQIDGKYDFEDLNVGFIMPSQEVQNELHDYIHKEISEIRKKYKF